jgi:hypothetical protein
MMTTTHPPLGPNDTPLLWGLFMLVLGAMVVTTSTGCGEVEPVVHAAVHAPACLNGCEDLNPCTVDLCMAEGCAHDPGPMNGAGCVEPGLPSGTCWDSACLCIDAAGCDDGEVCTADACNAGRCEHSATCET